MAINLITSPSATAPNVFAPPVVNHLNAHLLNVGSNRKIANGFVRQGSLFNVGGAMYLADSDTAITGANTLAIAVKMTPSGNTLIPSYVSDITGVTYSKDWLGWYDSSNVYYERLYCTGVSGLGGAMQIPGHSNSIYYATTIASTLIKILRSYITGTITLYSEHDSSASSWTHTIYKSQDGGVTWEALTSNTSIVLFVDVGDLFKCELVMNGTIYNKSGIKFFGMMGLSPEDIL